MRRINDVVQDSPDEMTELLTAQDGIADREVPVLTFSLFFQNFLLKNKTNNSNALIVFFFFTNQLHLLEYKYYRFTRCSYYSG